MNKKGFTLIELLAVIVILAVITLIVTPVITGIIDDAKNNANLRSAEGYYEAVSNRLLSNILKKDNELNDGLYTVSELDSKGVSFKGNKPTSGNIVILNGKVEDMEVLFDTSKISVDNNGSASLLSKAKIYGLKWDGNDHYTRLMDAVEMSSCVGTDTVSCISDFDEAEIYNEIHDVTVDGNAFVYIPKFYIKKVVNQSDSKNEWEWYISKDKKDDGYYLPECFHDTATNKELPYVLVGKYDASLDETGTKLVSRTGVIPLVEKNINEFRTYATNNNVDDKVGYQLFDIHAIDILQTLFYIEFGTLNSQNMMSGFSMGKSPWNDNHKVVSIDNNKITITKDAASLYKVGQLIDIATDAYGYSVATNLKITAINGDVLTVEDTKWTEYKAIVSPGNIIYNVSNVNGQTDTVKAKSGSIISNTNGKYSMKYRGIENLYGNLWQYIDGVNIYNNANSIYVNKNAKTYASDKIDDDYKLVCYGKCDTDTPISNLNTEGFVTKVGYDSSYPFINFPVSVGGKGDMKYGDYYWKSSSAEKIVVIFGGDWNNDINNGLSYFFECAGESTFFFRIGARLVKTAL